MSQELSHQYDPSQVESKWAKYWEEHALGSAKPDASKEPYCVVIPPPNVTGILHMGHALNNTIQDILVRWKRMLGYDALWVPGTDHAGIATQNVVERKLKKEGKGRRDLGREAFVREVWLWREQYGGTIIRQLKRLGASCDWKRERFTMDEGLSLAVEEVFIRLYEKGLIYNGNYMIHWCPRCLTALSDEEAEHVESDGHLWHIKYPIHKTQKFVVVATTRPETLFGDQAVAVSPKDERYLYLRGCQVKLPLTDRTIPVIEDEWVDVQFGTGLVKVTPSHDPNDFEIGVRHKLEPMVIMDEEGRMNENVPAAYQGMDRFACRKKVVEDLEAAGLIEKIEPHKHAVRKCYRCATVVEPRLSRQWFVRMKPLAEPAIKAVREGRVKFYPERWTKVYLEWMENIRDWCISRQIWWGHRIPIWTCEQCGTKRVGRGVPDRCGQCGSTQMVQEEDVLDTWFSSWLWPFSVFGWPKEGEDLKYFYPTSDLVTAQEIIFFWVARMIMAGLEFRGDVPFKNVYIHGTVRDHTGRKMSKSLGNTIDPIEVIEKVGADALRFSLMMITAQGQDVYLSNDKFEIGRTFCNKIWNASRFLLMNLESGHGHFDVRGLDETLLEPDDHYILEMLDKTILAMNESLVSYRFNEAAKTIYDFFWHHFCDRYIESAKLFLAEDDEPRKAKTRVILGYVLANSMKLLHPFMPHITEEIWSLLSGGESPIMMSSWPAAFKAGVDEERIRLAEMKFDFIRVGRKLRKDYQIAASAAIDYFIKPNGPQEEEFLRRESRSLQRQLKAAALQIDSGYVPAGPMPSEVCMGGTVYMEIGGLVDFEAETKRFQGKLEEIEQSLEMIKKKLTSQAFLQNAKPEVVEKEKAKLEELQQMKGKVMHSIEILGFAKK